MQDSHHHHHHQNHHPHDHLMSSSGSGPSTPTFIATPASTTPSAITTHSDIIMQSSSSTSSMAPANQNGKTSPSPSPVKPNWTSSTTSSSSSSASSSSSSSSATASSSASASKTEWVRLNIGGKFFVTTKTTLCRNHNSFFYKLLQDDPSIALTTDKDETGAYLIDRDPQYFAPILNYLRHGKLVIEKNLREEGVLEEAEFYNLPDLIHLVKERIREREETKNNKQNIKRVFRVIQFKESEITQMMSTMSDGWKFEQIVNVGSHYNYANDDHSEYLLIVSKEYGANEIVTDLEGSDKRKKIVRHA